MVVDWSSTGGDTSKFGGALTTLDATQFRKHTVTLSAELRTRGRQRVGLVGGFAVQRNDAAIGQFAMTAEQHQLPGDDAEAVVRDNDDAEQPQDPAKRMTTTSTAKIPVISCQVSFCSRLPKKFALTTYAVRRQATQLRHLPACEAA